MKLRFCKHSSRVTPRQEEIAAVLDWILTIKSGKRAPRVVVIDVDLRVKSVDFAMINSLYGSKLDLIPGLSADMISEVIRISGYDVQSREYNLFKCSGGKERCLTLTAIYDSEETLLYRKDVKDPIPDCREAPSFPKDCSVCRHQAVNIIIICPNTYRPAAGMNSAGRRLSFYPVTDKSLRGVLSDTLLPDQVRAETVLRELGLLVSLHGAFLNLDTISVFPTGGLYAGCEQVRPARWTVGETIEDYAIKLPRDERHRERIGLVVFEELCTRSNNRAGIVVSLPSADYVPQSCAHMTLLNRHSGKNGTGDSARVHYSMFDLTGIIKDMAKWGVRRYSLGYLDYTFGTSAQRQLTFTELSRAIDSAAAKLQTLYYRYTRDPAFGDGGHSYAHVDGVYKLEGGMFFQRVTEGMSPVKSFAPVPEMSNLRLGLSSDMNVGAPLPIAGEFNAHNPIERIKVIPHGAQLVNLNYKDMVAFVNHARGTICVHSPDTVVRSKDLRFTSFGVHREDEQDIDHGENQRHGCHRYISGAQHRARISVTVPVNGSRHSTVLQSVSEASRWLRKPMLTGEEDEWLYSKHKITTTFPSVQCSLSRLTSTLDSMHLISKTVECIRGTTSCMELGDYAHNGWPQGGTGYPIAISSGVDTHGDMLLKMIVAVNHGLRRVEIPCDLELFSFGSQPPSSPQPAPGYYMQRDESLGPNVKSYIAALGPLTSRIVEAVAVLYCPDFNRDLDEKAQACVTTMNNSLGALGDTFSRLATVLVQDERGTELRVQHVAYILARTSALCLSATVLALLINIALIVMLCAMCSTYRQQRFRKLK